MFYSVEPIVDPGLSFQSDLNRSHIAFEITDNLRHSGYSRPKLERLFVLPPLAFAIFRTVSPDLTDDVVIAIATHGPIHIIRRHKLIARIRIILFKPITTRPPFSYRRLHRTANQITTRQADNARERRNAKRLYKIAIENQIQHDHER